MENSSHPGRAIVTYGRSLMSLAIARSLDQRGIEVIGCDDVELNVLQFSRTTQDTFVHPPRDQDPGGYLDALEAAVQRYAPDDDRPYVLIPVFEEVRLLAVNRHRFEPTIRLAAPSVENIDAVHPKDALTATADRFNWPLPASRVVANPAELTAAARQLSFPMLLKPAEGAGGRGIHCFESAEELKAHVAAAPDDLAWPSVLQVAVAGEDYCCAVLAQRGEVKAVGAYVNSSSFPADTGAGAVRKNVDPAPFADAVAKVIADSGWHGVAEIDFRWDGQTDPQLIEVNPRFWAGVFHSIQSGIDFPALLYRLTAHGSVPLQETQTEGVETKTPGVWMLAAAQEVADSDEDLSSLTTLWKQHDENGESNWIDAARAILREVREGDDLDLRRTWSALSERFDKHESSASELSDQRDPFASAGVLFVLASLIRHGRLPSEMTFERVSKSDEHTQTRVSPPDEGDSPTSERRRPVIGVTKPDKGSWWAHTAIRAALWLAGAKSVALTASAPRSPELVDGVVLGGGLDVFPERYGAPARDGHKYDKHRDAMEVSWYQKAQELGIPVLGICRGVQLMNVAHGGTLHGDLDGFDARARAGSRLREFFFRKSIRLAPDSTLYDSIGQKDVRVNAIHKQALAVVPPRLRVVARDDYGIVQAVEDVQHPYHLGVQFHPEFLVYRADMRRLMKGFVAAAWRYRERRVRSSKERARESRRGRTITHQAPRAS